MEANLAPYKASYRYWTGLLLFIRIVLYLGIALDESNRNHVSLLVTSLIIASLFLLRTIIGSNVYRKRFIDCIDSLFLINLLAFCFVTLYFHGTKKQGQKVLSNISVSIAFIMFVCILFCHMSIAILGIRCHNDTLGHSVKRKISVLHKSTLAEDFHIKLLHFNETETQAKGLVTQTTIEVGLSDSIEYSTESSTCEEETTGVNEVSSQHSDKSESTEHYTNPTLDPTLALTAADIGQKDSSRYQKRPKMKRSKMRNWDKLRETLLQD